MGKQDVAVELFYDGAWHDLVDSDEVLASNPIVITRGQGDESQAPRPSIVTLTLNNDADKFRTSNPVSPLYGKAGVNTPLRVSVAGVIRAYEFVSSISCDQTSDFRVSPPRGSAWADVQAGGWLARVNAWSRQVKSPLRLATEGIASVSGYWALEDPAGATVASSTIPGTSNPDLFNHSFGSQNSPPGGGTAVDVGHDPAAAYVFQPGDPNSSSGWQLNRVIYLNKFTGGGALDPILGGVMLNGWSFFLQVDGASRNVLISVADANGVTKTSQTPVSTVGYQWLGRWIMVQLQTQVISGTTYISAYWRGVDENGWNTFSDSWSGTTTSDLWYAGALVPEGSSYGHVVGTKGLADPLTSGARFVAFQGHLGEQVADRFGRLNDENSIPYYTSTAPSSASSGPQGADTLANLYKVLQTTEDALIFDHRTEGRVFMLLRGDRYNRAPGLTLDADANPTGMPSLPAEVTDDLPINNIVTAKQVTGGDYTARDDTSAMGTQEPPDGRGEFKQSVDVNVADPVNDLPQQAYWWLARGTVDRPRFPQVTVDLGSLGPAKIAEVEGVDVGDVIKIVNFREYDVRLYVLGYKETIGTHTRQITFTCAPSDAFDVGVLDSGRLGARSTTLSAGITAGATSLTLQMTDPLEQWRPGNNAVPVLIGGELITLGTVGAVAGTGPWTQAVTGCTRAVNGIVKAHSAGDSVAVVGAIRLTL